MKNRKLAAILILPLLAVIKSDDGKTELMIGWLKWTATIVITHL